MCPITESWKVKHYSACRLDEHEHKSNTAAPTDQQVSWEIGYFYNHDTDATPQVIFNKFSLNFHGTPDLIRS